MSKLVLPHSGTCTAQQPCLACQVVFSVNASSTEVEIEPLVSALRRATKVSDDFDLTEPVDKIDIWDKNKLILHHEGIATVADLITRTEASVRRMRGMGGKAVSMLKRGLAKRGATFLDPKVD